MKTIDTKVGDETVTVEIQRHSKSMAAPYAVKLVARITTAAGSETRTHVHTFHPKVDRTPEDFDAAIQRAAQKLAEETVGHSLASAHIDRLLSE